jgi:hypothetical protein
LLDNVDQQGGLKDGVRSPGSIGSSMRATKDTAK